MELVTDEPVERELELWVGLDERDQRAVHDSTIWSPPGHPEAMDHALIDKAVRRGVCDSKDTSELPRAVAAGDRNPTVWRRFQDVCHQI
jgi:hypothetical protein